MFSYRRTRVPIGTGDNFTYELCIGIEKKVVGALCDELAVFGPE
jgi:hypothetical protein